jgi:hypothetical protein
MLRFTRVSFGITSGPLSDYVFFLLTLSLTSHSTMNETNPVKLNGVDIHLDLKQLAASWHVTPTSFFNTIWGHAFLLPDFPAFYDLVTFLYVLWLAAVFLSLSQSCIS